MLVGPCTASNLKLDLPDGIVEAYGGTVGSVSHDALEVIEGTAADE